MQYHYHMYSEPGSLVINAGERGNIENQIENLTGNQGEQWHSSIVQIPQFSDAVVSVIYQISHCIAIYRDFKKFSFEVSL